MRKMTAKEIALKDIAEMNYKLRIKDRKDSSHPHFESWVVPLYMLNTKENCRLNRELGI
jgi:hypothetical protein